VEIVYGAAPAGSSADHLAATPRVNRLPV